MRTWIGGVAAALLGCAPAASPPPLVEHAPPPVESALPLPTVAPSAAPPPAESAPPLPEPPVPPFPPPVFAPPYEHTAQPDDGAWSSLVPGGDGAPPLLLRTTVHADPRKPDVHVVVVAIDLRRVGVRLVAGTREPLSTAVPEGHRPGLIPAADQPDLLAVFNGGFMVHHGAWGMAVGDDVFLPPKDDACTVALLRGGAIRIRTFPEIQRSLADVLAYRQTPPCLVEQGGVSAALLGREKPRRWGMSETGGLDIRRSALGIAEGGRTLFYGLGEWVTPRQLAEAMLAAGAVDAAELDVNWSYTRFLLYGRAASPGAEPEVRATLIPKLKHAPGQYVRRPADRDFFYLVRKR
jgi:hypothetical protein